MKNSQQVKNGQDINFESFEDSVSLSFSNKIDKFILELNGTLIKTSKSFKPVLDKLNLLIELHDLEIID